MSKDANAPWVDKKGKLVTFEDCRDACRTAVSIMEKELKTNPVIRDSQNLSINYDRDICVMEVVRDKFDMMHKQTKKVERKTVKKRKRMIH